jgi:hypothetical protein
LPLELQSNCELYPLNFLLKANLDKENIIMKWNTLSKVLALLTAAVLLFVVNGQALAHGHTEVGDYELVIGFHNEPAFQSEPNGLDLFVTNTKTGEPVNGLEETLKAEIIFGSSKKELEIYAQWGQDGAYTADVLPTEAGDYTWHIWGEIEGTPVDVSMTSSPDTFSSVEAKSVVAFPAVESTPAELQTQAAAAAQTAQMALIIGSLGALLGLGGLIVGFLGLRAIRTSNSAQASQGNIVSQQA